MARKKASFTSFIFGMLFGIIVLLGGIAFGGYWAYNNLNVNTVEQLTGQKFDFIPQESLLRTKAIKDLVGEITGIPQLTFPEFEQKYIKFPAEMSFITDVLYDVKINELGSSVNKIVERVKIGSFLGAPYNDFEEYPEDYDGERPAEADNRILWAFRKYTLNTLQNFAHDITIGDMEEIFEISLPEFLDNDEVKNSSLSDFGDTIDNLYITNLFTPPDGDEEDWSMGEKILNRICTMEKDDETPGEKRPYKISEIDQLLIDLPANFLVQDMLTRPNGDESDLTIDQIILQRLYDSDCSIDEMQNEITDIVRALRLQDILKNTFDTTTATGNILNLIWEENPYIKDLSTGLSNVMNDLKISDIIINKPAPGTISNNIIIKIWDAPINELSSYLAGIRFEIRDLLPEQTGDSPSARLINFLRDPIKGTDPAEYYAIDEVDDAFNDMTIDEIFDTSPGSIFYLLRYDSDNPDFEGEPIKINDMDSAKIGRIIGNSTIEDLKMAGLIDVEFIHPIVQGKTINEIAQGDFDFGG